MASADQKAVPKPRQLAAHGARLIGALLTLACLYYVIREIATRSSGLRSVFEPSNGLIFGLCILLWILVNGLLGIGWRKIALCVGGRLTRSQSILLSLDTQAAKYMPGNVFHFAGRVILGRRYGLSTPQTSLATIGESALLIYAAVAIGVPILWNGTLAIPFFLLLSVLLPLSFAATRPLIRRALANTSLSLDSKTATGNLVQAFLTYVTVFLLQGFMLWLIARSTLPAINWKFAQLLQASSLSWAAGFVVIGSPGGLGVREAAMSFFQLGDARNADVLLIASGLRVCSAVGDFASLGVGVILRRLYPSKPTHLNEQT